MNLEILHVGQLGTNCYVTWDDDHHCAVIDCGGDADKVAAYLKEHNLTPLCLLLTHGHGDHMGGVADLKALYPDAKIYLHRGDEAMVNDGEKNMGNQVAPYWKPITVDQWVKEGDVIPCGSMNFTVLETHGHTDGGVTYIQGNQMYCGDTLFQDSMGRTDLYGGNNDKMAASLKRLSQIEGYYVVLPGHGAASNLEDERRSNPYMRRAAQDKPLF